MSEAAGKPSAAKAGAPKKKLRKGVTRGVAHVKATFNNTMVTITDANGETLSWKLGGNSRLKETRRRANAYAPTACG